MGESRDQRPPGFEIPDLELPPPRPSQSGLRSARIHEVRPDPRLGEQPTSGAFELDEVFSPLHGATLEVDHDAPIAAPELGHYGRTAGLSAEDFALTGRRVATPPIGTLELDVVWPTGSTPARERLVLDTLELRKLAGFGDPSTVWMTPWYALSVARRRRQLLAELGTIDPALSRAEAERDRLLCELALSVRPHLEKNPAFARLLMPLQQADRSRSSEAAKAEAELDRAQATAGAEQSDLAAANARAEQAANALSSAEFAGARLQARHKRCLIELRALGNRPQDAETEATGNALRRQADALLSELEAAGAALDQARAHRAAAERPLQDLEQRQQTPSRERPAQPESGAEQLGESELLQRTALVELARAVLALRGEVPVESRTLEPIRKADAEVTELLTRSELHLRALDVCDPDKLRQGQIGLVLLGFCMLALGVWLFYPP